MRRPALLLLVAIIAVGAIYQVLLGGSTKAGKLVPGQVVAIIGEGEDAVGVGADGTILRSVPIPDDSLLPQLPIATVPAKPRLAGPLLEQALVLGAAPGTLRPYIARSSYGESGVDVELRSGIELRFGTAAQRKRKWRAAAAVLADPSVTGVDYVDLHAPSRPAIYGSGHALPPLP